MCILVCGGGGDSILLSRLSMLNNTQKSFRKSNCCFNPFSVFRGGSLLRCMMCASVYVSVFFVLLLFLFAQHADVAVNKILIGNKCDMDEDREVRKIAYVRTFLLRITLSFFVASLLTVFCCKCYGGYASQSWEGHLSNAAVAAAAI